MDWSGPVGPQSMTKQPVLLGPKMDEKENDPVDQDVYSTGQGEPSGPTKYDQAVGLARADDGRDGKYSRVPREP